MKIARNAAELIGHTPLVALERLTKDLGVEILAKVEFFSPGSSIKDRTALSIINLAEQKGLLQPGGSIVSQTSGNFGTGLAIVAAARGYHMIAVLSETMSEERTAMLRALGAEVVLVKAGSKDRGTVTREDYERAKETAHQISLSRGAYWIDQFEEEGNPLAHESTTGEEIWDQTDGKLDWWLALAGSAGTVMGVARTLKRKDPHIQVAVVEPETSQPIAGGPIGGHKIQGVGTGSVPKFYDPKLTDRLLTVSSEEAQMGARLLAEKEGLFCGYSSGGNVAAALKLAQELPKGSRIVTILNDTGLKYLSTDLYR